MLLAEAVHETQSGPHALWHMTDLDRHELKLAALLHDCGKVTTPVHVVDKATKLQTLFDRINLIDTRFGVLRRDAELAALRGGDAAGLPAQLTELDADRAFLRAANTGGETNSPAAPDRVRALVKKTTARHPAGDGVDVPAAGAN